MAIWIIAGSLVVIAYRQLIDLSSEKNITYLHNHIESLQFSIKGLQHSITTLQDNNRLTVQDRDFYRELLHRVASNIGGKIGDDFVSLSEEVGKKLNLTSSSN